MKHNAIRWLWFVTGGKKIWLLALILTQAANGLSGVFYALLLRNIVDCATDVDRNGFWENVILIVGLVLGQIAIRAVIRFLEERTRSSLENLFKSRLLSNLLHKDYAAVGAVHSGEWMNRLTNDCVMIANHFVEILPGMTGMIVKLCSAAVMLIVLDARFSAILLPAGMLLLLLTYAFRKTLKKLHKGIQEKDGTLRIYLQECLGSMMMIRSFAAEAQTESEASEKMKLHQSARMLKNRFSNFCNIGFQSAMQCMYLTGACYCAYGIMTGTVSYGTLTAMTQLISQIQSPFANITSYLPKFYAMTASAERLMEIEEFADDCTAAPKTMAEIQKFYQHDFQKMGLRNAGFTYYPASEIVSGQSKEAMPVVLANISLEIRKGEYVAFTGHSGCGKSTILKLLMCIYRPDRGERYLSDHSGNEIALTPEWHRLFAYVPQGNQLMNGTIREVVAFADKACMHDEERIQNALQIACADVFVNALEQGVDTLLGERGTGLSEGQMQRIAVARAIFSESPVLLLDEATSALDDATERQLLQNLKCMTDKTVMIVTHRPAALEICDTVFRMTEDGIEQVSENPL